MLLLGGVPDRVLHVPRRVPGVLRRPTRRRRRRRASARIGPGIGLGTHAHDAPLVMTLPLWILALDRDGDRHLLHVAARRRRSSTRRAGSTPVAIGVALSGILLAWLTYQRRIDQRRRAGARRSGRSAARRSTEFWLDDIYVAVYRYGAARVLARRRLDRSLPRRRRAERRQRVDARWRRRPAPDADRQGAGLRVRRRLRPAGADGVDRSGAGDAACRSSRSSPGRRSSPRSSSWRSARHRPLLVRWTAVDRRGDPAGAVALALLRLRPGGGRLPVRRVVPARAVVRHLLRARRSTAWAWSSCC